MTIRNLVPILLVVVLSGCAHPGAMPPRAATVPDTAPLRTHENLDATLYVQTAAEYDAIALQTFRMAKELASEGMKDPSWSALDDVPVAGKPAAVIVDVDETVLDNSAYQARLILDEAEYDRESWKTWVEESSADAIPGAVDFARWCAGQGITLFYVTNRRADEESATRRNLESLGFPVRTDLDVVLTRGEREEWDSDKTTRRRHVAESFRVLLLIGDDLGDFVPRDWTSVGSREAIVNDQREKWGRQWLVLPNPTYGSWMSVLLDDSDSQEERLRLLYETLDPKR